MYAYLFIVGYGKVGPYCDIFRDVTSTLGATHDEYVRVIEAVERVGADSTPHRRVLAGMSSIQWYAKVTGQQLHKVVTETPITVEQLDTVLSVKQRLGELKQFLEASAI